jgi:hypothetical protein
MQFASAKRKKASMFFSDCSEENVPVADFAIRLRLFGINVGEGELVIFLEK